MLNYYNTAGKNLSAGPPRKYYSLTKKGNTFLIELDSTWKDLAKAVRLTTKTKKDE